MHQWIGTSGFQYPEWKGTFYPADLPASKMLSYYSERFRTTEINYSFRRIPSESTIAKWKSLTPELFRFSFKAPQRITHFAKLRDCEEILAAFLKALSGMGSKLGPVLFQLPPALKKDAPLLKEFLSIVPAKTRCAFEFRHSSWFDDEIYELLRAGNQALCIAESEDLAVSQVVTADFTYLRLRRVDYVAKDIERWAKFLEKQRTREPAFVYFKHEETGAGPKFAGELLRILGNTKTLSAR